ncbi:MAG: Crp/Fnr family transcriptional regulator [Gallionellales bacterium GWA2_60_18]|nr:MAG: Crp/Fnr family transcriptional regulator [Gallionellales bacterium GWA2_60_18]
MSQKHSPRQNRLLAALPAEGLKLLEPHLQQVLLRAGDILSEPDTLPCHAYFPVDCTLSLYYHMENGETAETAMIGNEGMFSVATILGGETMPYSATVVTTGHAFRIARDTLKKILNGTESLRQPLLLYSQALLTQMEQTAGCGRHHSLEQQLCLHLLQLHDSSLSDEFELTHEALAHMLGVRREGITKAAKKLRDAGLIDYRRGHIRILDRKGLDGMSCECYEVVRKEFKRLLGY